MKTYTVTIKSQGSIINTHRVTALNALAAINCIEELNTPKQKPDTYNENRKPLYTYEARNYHNENKAKRILPTV
jgi:hypothetical protein